MNGSAALYIPLRTRFSLITLILKTPYVHFTAAKKTPSSFLAHLSMTLQVTAQPNDL
jgi:hypothetical protein